MKLISYRSLILFLLVSLNACSGLPNPNRPGPLAEAAADPILSKSAEAAGNPWTRLRRVQVGFAGDWTKIVTKVQPDLVDAGFRQGSEEVYLPRQARVEQQHQGPAGKKTVLRTSDSVIVTFNGNPSNDSVKLDAAALVADAYTIFVFGSDYLQARGQGWKVVGGDPVAIGDDPCWLLAGTFKPGIGRSAEDKVIAWISQRTHQLRRIQFTLNGLESTAGADVDVTFDDFRPGPHGTVFPRHFVETVHRPLHVKAHDWRMTILKAE
ncbi:MAG: hypothetical protein KDK97_20135 [Verrucomicrobiales bacterium]|nr:hypothetical protein [Verrucomicrobiales bacterium]MCP5557150.1 hypothetical protein [Verrucomicrobiaceae bacterium]